jgi:hypothetical protein
MVKDVRVMDVVIARNRSVGRLGQPGLECRGGKFVGKLVMKSFEEMRVIELGLLFNLNQNQFVNGGDDEKLVED